MQKNNDKHIDKFLKKHMQQLNLDSPSKDFTLSIMKKVDELQKTKSIVYKPLINKKVGYVIFGSIALILIYTIYNIDNSQPSLFSLTNLFERIPTISIPKLSISSTIINSSLVIGVLFLIQIPLLKHYFNKRINL